MDEATEFQPQVRGEVGAFAWHYVAHLPASEEASMQYNNTEGARHKFFQVCTKYRQHDMHVSEGSSTIILDRLLTL